MANAKKTNKKLGPVENLVLALDNETKRLEKLTKKAESEGNQQLVERYKKDIALNQKLVLNLTANSNLTYPAE